MTLLEILAQEIDRHKCWTATRELTRNEYLKFGDTIDTNVYFVEKGSLRIFLIDNSEEHTIRFGYKNNFVAALDSFITSKPSDLSIQALKSTRLKVIGRKELMDLVEGSALLTKVWTEILENLIYSQMERERDLLITSPKERFLRVLARSPQLFQEIPHKYIASYLRMTPETLSRIQNS